MKTNEFKVIPTILIVDDRPDNLYLLETIIRKLDVTIIKALSGPEALQQIEGKEIAAALIDISMPGMDGLELATIIQQDTQRDKVPIIFISALVQDEAQLEKCYESGAVDFILKPFRNFILLSKVKVFLELYSQNQQIKANLKQLEDVSNKLQLQQKELELQHEELQKALNKADENAQKYINLYNFAPAGYFTLDNNSGICGLNINGADMLGSNCSGLIGCNFNHFVTPETLPVFTNFLRKVAETRSKQTCEVQLFHDEEPAIYVQIEGIAAQDDDTCLITVVDITKRKVAEGQLDQTRKNFEAFFNNLTDFIFVLDEQGVIVHMNDLVNTRLEYTLEELKGQHVSMVHPADQREEANRIIGEMLTGISEYCPIPLITRSGKQIPVETKISHGIWDGKRVLFGVSKDITQVKLSDEKFSKVFFLNPSACGLTDLATGEYLEVNEAFYSLLGFEKGEVIGKTPVELGIISNETIRSIKQRSGDYELVQNIEAELVAKSGIIKHVLLSAENIYLQDRTLRYTVVHDITSLRASEKLYRSLLNASPEGIIIMDLNGCITEISNLVLEIFGASHKDEFIGNSFANLIPPEQAKKVDELIVKTLSEGLIQNVEFILQRKNDTQFICEISATLIQTSDGAPSAFMAVIRDVSQRKKNEQVLIRTERMVSLGEMASAMAHEINQPLLSVTLGLENLFLKIQRTKAVDEQYFHDKSEKILDDILRISRIIDHVRAFSRESDNYILTSFDLKESILNAISLVSEQFKNRNIELILRLDRKSPPVLGNTYKFEQVMLNLLSNAKDAVEEKMRTSKNGYRKSITIYSWHNTKANYVEVKDNGSGIEPDIMQKIMLPFFTTKEVGKGTGLGLSISFGIIKEFMGDIEVESDPATGTIFRIVLPFQEK